MSTLKAAFPAAVKPKRTPKRPDKSRPCAQNWIERLPSEILLKILSYLNTAALFTLSHVSSVFYQHASDNALWHKIFLKEFGRTRKHNPKFVEDLLMKTDNIKNLDNVIGSGCIFKQQLILTCTSGKIIATLPTITLDCLVKQYKYSGVFASRGS
ncbi:hypothetical protein WMY93_030710 [Mugilogobius chulae]|uniref:F-box domain-containing protein n=1 Tax=Mugilogobius chulae TaxID=88201 RepID=A0AAW0MJP5_9GOBI